MQTLSGRLKALGGVAEGERAALLEEARRLLRRTPVEADLETMIGRLESVLDCEMEEMAGSDGQNDRHKEHKYRQEDLCCSDRAAPKLTREEQRLMKGSQNLDDVLRSVEGTLALYPDAPPTWAGIVGSAQETVKCLDIRSDLWEEAIRALGLGDASTVILCLAEFAADLKHPPAYLRTLLRRHECGEFNLKDLLRRAARSNGSFGSGRRRPH